MANRKKEDMIFFCDLTKIKETLLKENFGGDILVVSSPENLKKYGRYFPGGTEIKFCTTENFLKNSMVDESYGLVFVVGSGEEITKVQSKVVKMDITTILLITSFLSMSFLEFKAYKIFVDLNKMYYEFVDVNKLKALVVSSYAYFEKLFCNCESYERPQNIDIITNFQLLTEYLKEIYKNKLCIFYENTLNNVFLKITNIPCELLFLYYIFFDFCCNVFLKTEDIVFAEKQSKEYIFYYYNIVKRYFENYKNNNIEKYNMFIEKYNKEYLKQCFLLVLNNSKTSSLLFEIEKILNDDCF